MGLLQPVTRPKWKLRKIYDRVQQIKTSVTCRGCPPSKLNKRI